MPVWHVSKRALYYSALLFWGWLSGCSGGVQSSASASCHSEKFDETVVVEKIYDGDTIKLRDTRVVRFVGINTPETARDYKPAQPLAVEAKKFLESLFSPGTSVNIQYDRDRYDHHGRTLAHIYLVSGQNVSAALLEQGYGFAVVVPPNTAHLDCYFGSEESARKKKLGVWGHAVYQPTIVSDLSKGDTGFQYVIGRVTSVGQGKKNIWLDMGEGFSVRIQRKHLQYFANMPLEEVKGKRLRIRGWVSFYREKLRMNIGHPAMMEVVD